MCACVCMCKCMCILLTVGYDNTPKCMCAMYDTVSCSNAHDSLMCVCVCASNICIPVQDLLYTGHAWRVYTYTPIIIILLCVCQWHNVTTVTLIIIFSWYNSGSSHYAMHNKCDYILYTKDFPITHYIHFKTELNHRHMLIHMYI